MTRGAGALETPSTPLSYSVMPHRTARREPYESQCSITMSGTRMYGPGGHGGNGDSTMVRVARPRALRTAVMSVERSMWEEHRTQKCDETGN